MTKPLVIYHKNCNDGFGAATAAYLALGDDAEYLPVQYNDPLHKGGILQYVPYREVYILDFSFPRDVMESIISLATRVTWLDHHKTAFEVWCNRAPDMLFTKFKSPIVDADDPEIILDDLKSGALLAYEYFSRLYNVDTMPTFALVLDDYDRWQFRMPITKFVNAALRSQPLILSEWAKYYTNPEFIPQLATEGEAIERYRMQQVESIAAKATKHTFPGVESLGLKPVHGLAVNCNAAFTSDVGHVLAKRCGTYALCWSLQNNGQVASVSLRSEGNYDVSELAKRYGGGGHKNAAGFELSMPELLTMFGGRAE